jgi:hypothetical protein
MGRYYREKAAEAQARLNQAKGKKQLAEIKKKKTIKIEDDIKEPEPELIRESYIDISEREEDIDKPIGLGEQVIKGTYKKHKR